MCLRHIDNLWIEKLALAIYLSLSALKTQDTANMRPLALITLSPAVFSGLDQCCWNFW
jgi:hypothetical protein